MPANPLPLLALLFLALPMSWAADGAGAPTATPPPAAAADAAKGDAAKVAFGIITISADKTSLTMAEAKGGPLTLKITDKTEITRDLNKVALSGLILSDQVRVTYSGDTALSIDQVKPDKKKKKKT